MTSKNPANPAGNPIDPNKGTYITGNVSTEGGDFIGRDKIIYGDEIIYQLPSLRCQPLERPPRAQYFQDREVELTKLLSDLQPGQVVTLCGPGGIGKSALAAEIIWRLAPGTELPTHFSDGIILYNFSTQSQADSALEHIARSLGEDPQPTPEAAARRALAGRRVLLLLEGTEEADNLGKVLNATSGCGVLVTSRRRDDAVNPNYRCDIKPLPMEKAVNLLHKWGGKRADDSNIVKKICELVGRVPLAVRLVGSYLAASEEDVGEYLPWLEETLLEALDWRDHQTESIPFIVEHSVHKISEKARQVLAVTGLLSSAPFGREVITAALELKTREIHQALGELVNHALLERPETHYQVTHALIYHYTQERMTASEEVLTRLAAYYTTLSQEQSKRGGEGYTRLDPERLHIMAVLKGCVQRKKWTEVQALGGAIESYLNLQGYFIELVAVYEASLKAARALKDRWRENSCLGGLGFTYTSLDRAQQAIGFFQQAISVAREIGDPKTEITWLGNIAHVFNIHLKQYEQAIEYLQQALMIPREIGDRARESAWLGHMGAVYSGMHQEQQAINYYQQAVSIAHETGDQAGESCWLRHLGYSYTAIGEGQQAIIYFQQALASARASGDRQQKDKALSELGEEYGKQAQYDMAFQYLEQAVANAQERGDRPAEAASLHKLALVYLKLAKNEQAIVSHQRALTIAREIRDRRQERNYLGQIGSAYRKLGQYQQAIHCYEQALAISRERADRGGEGTDLRYLGFTHHSLGQYQQAIHCHEQALVIARELGDHYREGDCLGNLGEAYASLGQLERAIVYYEQALTISRNAGDRDDEGSWLEGLGKAYYNLSQMENAQQYWNQALRIFEESNSSSAEKVRKLLAYLPSA